MQRDFKGVRIPKEIRLDEELSIMMKVLLVEIDSLDNGEGCFAGNSYFAEFFGVSETQISKYIAKLKELGYIEEAGFDGRKRYLKSRIKEKLKAGLNKSLNQPGRKVQGRVEEKFKHNNIYNNTNNNKTNVDFFCDDLDTTTLHSVEGKDEQFETFWKMFPHGRNGNKKESKGHFMKQDTDEVIKEVQLLRYKVYFGLADPKYIPACKRWIRDFTPTSDIVVKDVLINIMKKIKQMPVGEDRTEIVKNLSEVYGKEYIDDLFKQANSGKIELKVLNS